MPEPLAPARRAAIADDIRAGRLGCNAIARLHGVSPGTVSKIARQEGHFFERSIHTATATRAHQIDCAAARLEKEIELTEKYYGNIGSRHRDGRETKASRRLGYQLYDLNRHHRYAG